MEYKVTPAEWPDYKKPARKRGRCADVSNVLTDFMKTDIPCIKVEYPSKEDADRAYKALYNYSKFNSIDCKLIIRKTAVFIKKGSD